MKQLCLYILHIYIYKH